jgi:hypothetical protein
MKDIQGYLIIGISIIISAIIIVFFFPDRNASINDCYQKVYKNELGKSTSDYEKSEAARYARKVCK